MKILMISLDKNILNKNSIVARRMIEYGKEDELFIIIPSREREIFDLSSTVHVQSTGGNKVWQFHCLKEIGKKLIRENNIEKITTQDPFFIGLIGWCLKCKFKIKLEVQVHGDFFNKNRDEKYYYRFWRRKLGEFITKRADIVRAAGERIKQSLLKLDIVENKIKVRPIQNDPELIRHLSLVSEIDLHSKYPGYEKIFLILGRLDPVKNIPWLIEIFKKVIKQKNYLLLIVGRGEEEQKIRSQVISNNLDDNIKLQNWTEDPYGYLKTADCVLFPSLSEGYGLVAMEANIVGTPVIMTDVGEANYELKPGPKVKIVPVGDKDAFVKEMLAI